MVSVLNDGSRVHCIRKISFVPKYAEKDTLEHILHELGIGCADKTKRRYRAHCLNPDTMTRTTVIALDELLKRLNDRGVEYYPLRIAEIKRLILAAPSNVKNGLILSSFI